MPDAALVSYDLVDVCYGITVVAVTTCREKQSEIELKIESGQAFQCLCHKASSTGDREAFDSEAF